MVKNLIFVTVGTSSFDPLVQAIDEHIKSGAINDRVVIQIGEGKYIPKSTKFFRLSKSIKGILETADIIITTGGAGTLLECLTMRKRVIGVENTSVLDSHQWEILKKLESDGYIKWCRDFEKIPELIKKISKSEPKEFNPELLDIKQVLSRVLSMR